MADENDPDRPEDDLPAGAPNEGESTAEPLEAAASEPVPPDHHKELFEETEAEAEAEAEAPVPPPPEQLPPIPEDLPIAAEAHREEVAAPEPTPAPKPDELPPHYFHASDNPEKTQ